MMTVLVCETLCIAGIGQLGDAPDRIGRHPGRILCQEGLGHPVVGRKKVQRAGIQGAELERIPPNFSIKKSITQLGYVNAFFRLFSTYFFLKEFEVEKLHPEAFFTQKTRKLTENIEDSQGAELGAELGAGCRVGSRSAPWLEGP